MDCNVAIETFLGRCNATYPSNSEPTYLSTLYAKYGKKKDKAIVCRNMNMDCWPDAIAGFNTNDDMEILPPPAPNDLEILDTVQVDNFLEDDFQTEYIPSGLPGVKSVDIADLVNEFILDLQDEQLELDAQDNGNNTNGNISLSAFNLPLDKMNISISNGAANSVVRTDADLLLNYFIRHGECENNDTKEEIVIEEDIDV